MSVNGDHGGPSSERSNRFAFLEPAPDLSGAGHSGRRLVIIGLAVMFTIAGALFAAYQVYLAQYRETVAFGERELVPVVDLYAKVVPEGESPESWSRFTAATRRMVEKVVRSGTFDVDRLTELSRSWRERAQALKPETALAQLTRIWIEMEVAAAPKIATTRQGDPKDDLPAKPDVRSALALALTIPPLENRPPAASDSRRWAQDLADTRWMLATTVYSQALDAAKLAELAQAVRARVAKIAANPDANGVAELQGVWSDVEARAPQVLSRPDCPPRPAFKGEG